MYVLYRMKYWSVILLLLTLAACGHSGSEPRKFPFDEMRTGDLAFRCGRGVLSRGVLLAERKGNYSHVGVVILDTDGKWKIAHSVPAEREFDGDFDRVKLEPIEDFYSHKMAARGCLVHVGNLTDSLKLAAMCEEARQAFRDSIRFDHDYNLQDSTELYCSEYVWMLYKHYGVDLSEGRRRHVNVMKIHDDVLLPQHLLEYKDNITYFLF